MIRLVEWSLWLLPLAGAWWSPLADRAEWRWWMVLPFVGCWAALQLIAGQRTLTIIMVLRGVARQDRTWRRWSPYPTCLLATLVVWPLARPLTAGAGHGGAVTAALVAAVLLPALWGAVEVPVALVLTSAFLAVSPTMFVVLAAPAAGAVLAGLALGMLVETGQERVTAAANAGALRRARRLALRLLPLVPLRGPSQQAELLQLAGTLLWRTGSAGRAVWLVRLVAVVRGLQGAVRYQLSGLLNVAMFQYVAARYPAALRSVGRARTVLDRRLPRYLAKVERLPAERAAAEIAAFRAELAVETVQIWVATGDVSRAGAAAARALAAFDADDPAGTHGAAADSEVLARLHAAYRSLIFAQADIAGAYLHDEARAELLYRRLITQTHRFDDAVATESRLLAEIRLATVLTRQGRYAEATAKLEQVRADPATATVLGPGSPVVTNLANLARLRGDHATAERLYRQVLPVLPQQINQSMSVGVLSGLGAVVAARGRLAEGRELAGTAVRRAEELGAEMQIRSSSIILGRICEQAGDDDDALRCYRRAADLLESTRSRLVGDQDRVGYTGGERRLEAYERLVALHLRRGEPAEAFGYAERAKARALLDRLGETAAAPAPQWRTPLTAEQVRQALAGAGRPVLLVEYFVGDGRLTAFGVRAGGAVEARAVPVDLVEVRRFAQANFGTAGQVREMTASGLDELWHGFDAIVGPVAEWSRPGDVVVFVPHAILHHLPLHALRVGGQYVIERNPVGYAPSASVLVRARAAPATRTGRMAVFGDPGGDLPHARSEALSVAGLFGTAPLLGADVTVDAFVRRTAGASLVHYAGHASFDSVDAGASGLHLAGGQRLAARQIQHLPRLRPRVVTLSGCETGISRRRPGEELIGLTRSFLFAGAATVVASLWRVADESSTELMRTFYSRLVLGDAAVDALRTAMLSTARRRRWSPLYHWAPFILIGDWE